MNNKKPMTPERLAELGEYPDPFDDLAQKLPPEQLAARIALKDAAYITREMRDEIERCWGKIERLEDTGHLSEQEEDELLKHYEEP